ncbi:MAG TPA: hypothetical protein VF384_15110 [Planctomycetota bacterium]
MRELSSVLLLTALAAAQGSPLTETVSTEHFTIRFRPASRAEASVDRVRSLVEADLAMILKEVGLREFEHNIQLFLYDDVAELQRITKVPAAGYSTTLQSHVPHDNDQTRVHELVHVVAEQFTEKGPEKRNLFVAEGLANAVLRYVSGVSVDAVAAFHRRRGDLPAMGEIHELDDFYAWLREHPAVNAYDVAGSWVRFLLDTYGAGKVRQYYKGVPVTKAFGKDLAALEKAWHERLDKVKLRPGVLSLLGERHARSAAERSPNEAKLGEAILGPASEWLAMTPDVHELSGDKNNGDWCVKSLGDAVGDAIVRCTAVPADGCFGVRLDLGQSCQALLLRGQGTFVYVDDKCVGHERKVQLGSGAVEIVLRRQRGKATIWIDGQLAAEGAVPEGTASLGIGCVGGRATVRAVAVRRL